MEPSLRHSDQHGTTRQTLNRMRRVLNLTSVIDCVFGIHTQNYLFIAPVGLALSRHWIGSPAVAPSIRVAAGIKRTTLYSPLERGAVLLCTACACSVRHHTRTESPLSVKNGACGVIALRIITHI